MNWATAASTGLLLACTEAPPIIESTTQLDATTDTVGPYFVRSVVVDVSGSESVQVYYATEASAQFIPLTMQQLGDSDLYVAGLPGQPAGSRISYFVAVVEDGVRLVTDPVGAAALPYSFIVESP